MTKNKKTIIYLLATTFFVVILGVILLKPSNKAYATSQSENNTIGILDNANIEYSTYLYNFDDSPDYIYVSFH